MRFVPVNCLRPGMICGQDIIGKKGEFLLGLGVPLQDVYIRRLRHYGFHGIYITDTLSEDIVVADVINNTLRARSVTVIKELFADIRHGKSDPDKRIDTLENLVDSMLDQIITSNDIQVNMLDLKIFDDYTYFHSVNVCVLSLLLGHAAGMNRQNLHVLGMAAILHDIGKVFIDKEILNKPGRLSEEEFNIIKDHPGNGYKYLLNCFKVPEDALSAILDHHERVDGSGYPNGKTESGICKAGQIIAVSDVFDALTSDRPYRRALPTAEAIEYVMGCSNSAFNTDIVKIFLQKIVPYPPGVTVSLSDGSIGIVVRNNPQACLRPVIRIYKAGGRMLESTRLIDLLNDRETLDLTITGTAEAEQPQ